MPSIPHLAQALKHVLTETANAAALSSGMVKRHRAISGAQFVQTLVFGWLENPSATSEDLVAFAQSLGVSITPQGFANRFSDAAVDCLHQVVQAALAQVIAAEPLAIPLLARFSAVLLQDSTTISLPPVLADQFRGCGGKADLGAAAMKAQLRLELRTGQLEGPLFQEGRTSDRALDFVQRPPEGSLLLRDLGYFSLDDLASQARDGRFWVSRLKPRTQVYSEQQALDLLKLLESCQESTLDLSVAIGVKQRITCRLIAVRVPQEVADQRRRKMQRTGKKKGRTVGAIYLALCEWTVVVTNVPAAMLSANEVLVLLKMRWQIELVFKLWKSQGQIDKTRGTRPTRILAELYAKFIGMLIQHWLLVTGCWQAPERSLPKAARYVRQAARELVKAISKTRALEARLRRLMHILEQSERQRPRIKQPNAYQLLLDPSLLRLT